MYVRAYVRKVVLTTNFKASNLEKSKLRSHYFISKEAALPESSAMLLETPKVAIQLLFSSLVLKP